MQQPVGEDVAALGVGGELDFVDSQEGDAPVERLRLDRADEIPRRRGHDLLLARDQRHGARPFQGDDPIVILAGQQPERKADHSAGMAQHPLDGEKGLAGVGRAKDGGHPPFQWRRHRDQDRVSAARLQASAGLGRRACAFGTSCSYTPGGPSGPSHRQSRTSTAMTEEKLQFQAEVSRLLDIVAHSLYSEKEIFLRELISNASDACDRLRYAALTEPHLIADDPDLKVVVSIDRKAGSVTVADNGIGMNREDLVENLGTIARSGTARFLSEMPADKGKDLSLIGQFGVGFYSAFMVADRVEVFSRKAGDERGWHWQSE